MIQSSNIFLAKVVVEYALEHCSVGRIFLFYAVCQSGGTQHKGDKTMDLSGDTWIILIGLVLTAGLSALTVTLGVISINKSGIQELQKSVDANILQFRTEVSNNYLALGNKIDGVQKDLHQLDKKVDKLEVRFDNLEVKVDNLEVKVNNLDTKVNELDRKVDGLEVKVNDMGKEVTHLGGMLHDHINGHSHAPQSGAN